MKDSPPVLERLPEAAVPRIDPSARVIDSCLGDYTDVGAGWQVVGSRLGDYSYLAGTDGR